MTNKDVEEVTRGFTTIADYALVVKNLPKKYNNLESELTQVFENQFGSVVEVIVGRDYGETLYTHVKLNKLRMEIEYE